MSTRVIAIAAAVFAIVALSPHARADDAAALLLKHKAYAGWDISDPAMTSWHMRGTRIHGRSNDTFEEFRRGIVFRDAVATPSGVGDQVGFTGTYVWHGDENDYWQVVHGREAQAAIEWSLVRAEALSTFPAQIVGEASIGGVRCDVLRVQPKGLVAMDVYEDPNSGAFLRAVVAPGALGETQFNDIGYVTAPSGKRVVGSWTTAEGRYNVSDVAPGNVATSDLVSPASDAVWSYSDAAAPLVISALDLNERQIWVRATVNGRTGTFLLGTNTPSIILFDPFASQAGVANLGTSDFSPYVGNLQFEGYARAQTLQVGRAVLHNVVVQKIDAPNSKLAGVLGYDFFAHAIVDVDLADRTLRIADPQTYRDAGQKSSYTFPLDLTQRVPAIAMTLPSGAVAHPVFDSGLTGFMMLSQALYDSGKIGGHQLTHDSSVHFVGVGATGDPISSATASMAYTAWNSASTSGICMLTDRISVGPYQYENPPICLGGTNVFGDDGGSIGLDFMRHFNWIVDYPHEQFTLTPNGQ